MESALVKKEASILSARHAKAVRGSVFSIPFLSAPTQHQDSSPLPIGSSNLFANGARVWGRQCQGLDVAEKLEPSKSVKRVIGATLNDLADALSEAGDYDGAREVYEKS